MLSSIDSMTQSDDKIVMYRRHENNNTLLTSWEQIVFDREAGTVESSCVGPNPNGSMFTVEKSIYSSEDENNTKLESSVYDN